MKLTKTLSLILPLFFTVVMLGFSMVGFAQPTSNSPVCEGLTINLNAGLTADTYQWSGPNGFASGLANPSLAAVLEATGTYTLTITSNGNTQTFTTNVLVNAAPQTPNVDNLAGCAGDQLKITPTNSNASLTYTWKLPNNTTVTGLPLNVNTNGGNGTGNYTVVSSNANCSSKEESFSIAVFAKPGLATVNGSTSICKGEALNLSASNTSGNSVTWIDPQQNETNNINYNRGGMTLQDAGTYGVKLSNPGCQGQVKNFAVNVLEAPTGFDIAGDDEYCTGDNIVLNVTYGGNLNSARYDWTGPNGFSANTRAINVPASTAASGDYQVKVTVNPNANNGQKCASDPVLKNITVYDYPLKPTIDALPGVQVDTVKGCEGDEVKVWGSNKQANWAVNWTSPKGPLTSDTILFSAISLADTGAYSATYVNGICASPKKNFRLALTEIPKIDGYERAPFICNGDSFTVVPNASLDYDYEWTLNGNLISTADTLLIDPIDKNTHSGELVIKSSYFGCEAPADTMQLAILGIIQNLVIYHDQTLVCEGTHLHFHTNPEDSATYLWEGPNNHYSLQYGGYGFTQRLDNVSKKLNEGTYSVIVSNACGSDTAYRYFSIERAPSFELSGDTGICDYEETEIKAELLINEPLTYNWSNGDTDPIATITRPGKYQLEATNQAGCSSKQEFEIVTQCDPVIYVPNAFTPNGDGINDELKFVAHNVARAEILIFGRNGEQIFRSTDPNAVWNGDNYPTGFYFYRILYSGSRDGEIFNHEFNGNVHMIR